MKVKMTASSSEVEWLTIFLIKKLFIFKLIPHVSIHWDNQDTIAKTKNKTFNGKSFH